eukprot:295686-Rhodomonas_salina.2
MLWSCTGHTRHLTTDSTQFRTPTGTTLGPRLAIRGQFAQRIGSERCIVGRRASLSGSNQARTPSRRLRPGTARSSLCTCECRTLHRVNTQELKPSALSEILHFESAV